MPPALVMRIHDARPVVASFTVTPSAAATTSGGVVAVLGAVEGWVDGAVVGVLPPLGVLDGLVVGSATVEGADCGRF